MGFTPVQKPHPPIWIGAQSDAAAARAGRLGDGLLAPPQATLDDIRRYGEIFHAARRARGLTDRAPIGAYRNVCVAERRDEAYRLAESVLPTGWAYYKKVGLQEPNTPELVIPFEREVRERALVGDPVEVAERIAAYAEVGVTHIYTRLIQAGWSQQMPTDTLRVLCELRTPRGGPPRPGGESRGRGSGWRMRFGGCQMRWCGTCVVRLSPRPMPRARPRGRARRSGCCRRCSSCSSSPARAAWCTRCCGCGCWRSSSA
jgi:hypothetical protein